MAPYTEKIKELFIEIPVIPQYSQVQMNKRLCSIDLSHLVSFWPEKENLWCTHVLCCAENSSWTSIWDSWKEKDGTENFTWVARLLHVIGAKSRAALHLCLLATMVANRCCDACRKQQIRITSQGNCYALKLHRMLQLVISYNLVLLKSHLQTGDKK